MGPTLVCCFSTNQGGMELMAFDLCKLLSPLGEVFLVCRSDTFIYEKSKSYGVSSEVIGISFKTNFSFKFIREFTKILEEKKIKNVIFLGASELKSIYFACKNKNINIINFHGTTKTHSKKDFLHRIIYKVVNTHVTVSDHIKKNVKEIIPLFPHTNIKTIYSPKRIDYSLVAKDTGTFNCLLVGRIVFGKGHSDAIDACEYATKQGYNVNLKFVGNIEDKKLHAFLLEKLSNSVMKEKCTFEGHQDNVAPFYSEAHFLLFPSLGEGLPGVLLEAFQYGLLPVTYNNTVFPEFLNLGFEFPQAQNKSVSDLQMLLVDAIKNYSDWKHKIQKNYNLSKKIFSYEHIQKEYLSIMK